MLSKRLPYSAFSTHSNMDSSASIVHAEHEAVCFSFWGKAEGDSEMLEKCVFLMWRCSRVFDEKNGKDSSSENDENDDEETDSIEYAVFLLRLCKDGSISGWMVCPGG